MRFTCRILLIVLLFTSCFTAQSKNYQTPGVIYNPSDREIFEKIINSLLLDKNLPVSELMIKSGSYFIGTPYVAKTLETEPEQLIVNLRELDCTTFAENVLAIARTVKSKNPSFETFTKELQHIRYHNGIVDGYPSRIHYFSDWIFESNKKNLIKDVSKEITNIPYPLQVNFMSTHPESYVQLKDSTLIPVIAEKEQEISKREMYFIPEERIAEFENQLKDGDIAGITTSIKGLDISHVVILQRVAGKIHILHASTTANKVILSEETLEEYLKNSKSATGIMVARPL